MASPFFRRKLNQPRSIPRVWRVAISLFCSVGLAFGHNDSGYSHDSGAVANNPDWMAGVSDSMKIRNMSIPGTHDALAVYRPNKFDELYASGYITRFLGPLGLAAGLAAPQILRDIVYCQSMTLPEQLQAGIRLFDVRCAHVSNRFAINHGDFFMDIYFDEVLADSIAFLRAHPTETIFLAVGSNGVPDDKNCSRSRAQTMTAYLASLPAGFVWKKGANGLSPTLGETRGKIVFLRQLGDWNEGGQPENVEWPFPSGDDGDVAGETAQNHYALTTNWDLYHKWELVKDHLFRAAASPTDDLYINFLSASSGSPPYFVASGHSSNGTKMPRLATGLCEGPFGLHTGKWIDFPRVNSTGNTNGLGIATIAFEGTNTLTKNLLESGAVNGRIGMLMIDFPGAGLINAIIKQNTFERIVTTTANSGAGSLRQAIADTVRGDTIRFASSLSGQTITLASELAITKDVTIDASSLPRGITISGNNACRVFKIENANVSLKGLSIVGGNAPTGTNGGGISYVGFSTTLTVTNCTISGNTAGSGGGISFAGVVDSSNLILIQSTIAGNTAITSGGGIYSAGKVLLHHCTVAQNTAPAGQGGGVFSVAAGFFSGPVIMNNTIIAGNTSSDVDNGAGGSFAIHPSYPSWGANVIGTGNAAAGLAAKNWVIGSADPLLTPLGDYGGPTKTVQPRVGSPAIDSGFDSTKLGRDQRGFAAPAGAGFDVGAVELQSSVIVTTTADSGEGSLREALKIVAPGGTVTFDAGLDGQLITLTSGLLTMTQNVTVDGLSLPRGVTVSGNNASRVFSNNAGVTSELRGLTVTGGNAGGISNAGTLKIARCTVSGNSNGGVVNASGSLTLENSTIAGNTAAGGSGGGVYSFLGPVSVVHCTISGNSAAFGGGISLFGAGSSLTIQNSIVSGNTATDTGPDLYRSSASDTITPLGQNIIGDNQSVAAVFPTTANPMLLALGDYGGSTFSMLPQVGSPAIDAATAGAVTVDQRGIARGAQPDIGAVEAISFPLVVSGTADNDTAPSAGSITLRGAVRYSSPGATITFAAGLSGQTVTLGGNPLVISKNLTIDASALGGGLTISGHSDGDDYLESGESRVLDILTGITVTLNKVTIRDGVGDVGGGIRNAGNLTLLNCVLTGNRASLGGGLANLGTLTVTNSAFTQNAASLPEQTTYVHGGALVNFDNANATVTGSTFSGNTAQNDGGALYNFGLGHLTLTNCTVAGNTAQYYGGGMVNFGELILQGVTITGNTAVTNQGGGFSTNTLPGSISTVTIGNSIVAGNTAGAGMKDIRYFDGTVTASSPNLIGSNESVTAQFPTGTLVGTDAAPLNPKLAPLGNYGGARQTVALLPASPALDAGTSGGATPTTDQRGLARVGAPDLGAYESQGFTLAVSDGNNQSAPVGSAFANPLVAVLRDNGFLIPGGSVTFTAPGSGASGTFPVSSLTATVVTDASGLATAPVFRANATAGGFNVTASAPGSSSATFGLTGVAANITANTSSSYLVINCDDSGRTVSVTQSGANVVITSTAGTVMTTDDGSGTGSGTNSVTVPRNHFEGISVYLGRGSGTLNLGSITGLFALQVYGYGGPTVNFNGDITMDLDTPIIVNIYDDGVTPGAGTINVGTDVNLVTTGPAYIFLRSSGSVNLASGASVETVDGNILIEGNQWSTAKTGNFNGVKIDGGLVQCSGTGTVTVNGRGGNDSGGNQIGVHVRTGGKIRGGTTGKVTVNGTGGASTNWINRGVTVYGANSEITSIGAPVEVTGQGGTAGSNYDIGVSLLAGGSISAGGAGTVTVKGTGGGGGGSNQGVEIGDTDSGIHSGGGAIQVTGTAGAGTSTGLFVGTSGHIGSGSAGDITLVSDSVALENTVSVTTPGAVTFRQKTDGKLIDLGGADATNTLGLTDEELDRVTAATVNFGNEFSGDLSVSAVLSRPSATAMTLRSGGAVHLGAGLVDSAGGNVTLLGATTVDALGSGADISLNAANTFALGPVTFEVAINGAAPDSGYSRLVVNGQVNLTGSLLSLGGTYVPGILESFVIVNNDGADAITGTFIDLPQGSVLDVQGVPMTLSYTGGDGNDVSLTYVLQPPSVTSTLAAAGNYNAAFSYQITGTFSPTSFGATGLPAGLSIDGSGLISGTPTEGGVFAIPISVTNSAGTGTATLTLTISSPVLVTRTLSSEPPGWTRTGQWAFGTPSGSGGASNGHPDPTGGATGTNVFGVNLAGDYSTATSGPHYLTTAPINLSGRIHNTLRFQRWLNTDFAPYATATVEVSKDGTNWTTVWSNGGTEITDSAWTQVEYDISEVADNERTVYVRWGYSTGAEVYPYSGWNIDDIQYRAVTVPPGLSVTGDLTHSPMEGGTFEAGNLAAGKTAFALNVIPGVPAHTIPHLNDGTYGNSNSWLGNTQASFAGINLGATPVAISRVVFSRDNTGTFTDRCLGTYTIEYTTTPNPDETTTAWTTIGTVNYQNAGGVNFVHPNLRHGFQFPEVQATGIRISTNSNSSTGSTFIAIDEIELYGPLSPLELWAQTNGLPTEDLADPASEAYRRALLQFALGMNPSEAGPATAAKEPASAGTVEANSQRYARFTYRRRQGGTVSMQAASYQYQVDGITYHLEVTGAPAGGWHGGSDYEEEESVVANGDGTETVTVRWKEALPAQAAKGFFKVTISQTPAEVQSIAGFMDLPAPGDSDTRLSTPLYRPAEYRGTITALNVDTITLRSANFANGQFTGTPPTHYLLLLSGAKSGRWYEITGSTATTLTLNADGETFTAGDFEGASVAVNPFWTLDTLMPNGRGIHPSSTLTPVTEILTPNAVDTGINLSTSASYFYYNGASFGGEGWRKRGAVSSTKFDDQRLLPGNHLIVRHNDPAGTELGETGLVRLGVLASDIRTLAAGEDQDNPVAFAVAKPVSLKDSRLVESGAFAGSATFSPADELFEFDNAATGLNKSNSASYFYYTGALSGGAGWRQRGNNQQIADDDLIFKPGHGYVIRKKATAQPERKIWSMTPAYPSQP